MVWDVEYTDEFGDWWETLSENQQDSIIATTELLMECGPGLKFPHSSGIEGSRHSHMRELRVQSGGNPIRIFYAFDPRRMAILLIGGDKTGKDRFYTEYIPVADKLYDEHLEALKREGLIK
ncbi:MAG: type II toxin-antitoxin system RelE/ParE family toxin [Wenzhouxiangellaceae bacterium]